MWPFKRPPDIEKLAARLHWVFWVSNGWKPGRMQDCASAWAARDEKVKSTWRAVAEEAQLPAELL